MLNTGVLMGIDPGPHCGVAVKIDGRYHTATLLQKTELWDMLKEHRPDMVGYERFDRSNRIDPAMIYTMELVGSIEGACHVLGITAHQQKPQMRRAFILEAHEILKNTQPTPHEVDALAHLLLLEYRVKENML